MLSKIKTNLPQKVLDLYRKISPSTPPDSILLTFISNKYAQLIHLPDVK